MISVGRMAKEYGLLPSEVVARATTYDIMITDVLATYEAYQQQKANGTVDPELYDQDPAVLAEMMAAARNPEVS